MLRAVIVEDEMLVKLGMKMCIEQSEMPITIAGAFSSAEEAIAFFEENSADILITDIKLTGLTGLDLLEHLKPKLSKMVSVVLSCYEDFSYARRGYEIGADKYILKHELKEEELAKLLIALHQKKFEQPCQDYITATDSPKAIAWPMFEVPQFIKNSAVQRVSFLWLRSSGKENFEYEKISFPMLCETANEVMHIHKCGQALLHPHDAKILLLFQFENTMIEETQNKIINQTFNDLRNQIKTYFNLNCLLYIAPPCYNQTELLSQYALLKKTQRWLFYYETSAVIPLICMPEDEKIPNKFVIPSPICFTPDWQNETILLLEKYFILQKENLCDPDLLKIEADRYLHTIYQALQHDFGISIEDIFTSQGAPNYLDIDKVPHVGMLLQWIMQITDTICLAVREECGTNPLVNKIIAYAKENYTQKITLENVADQFHINVTYFCRIFKKQTGENFVTFLNRLRIEQAIVLLNTTDMTIEQIADEVGIKTANYFFRLFKKITGKTVGHYRKR